MIRSLVLMPLLLLIVETSHAEVTDAQVKDIAKELACLCGTCPRRPLDECTCGWAVKNRNRIAAALETGQDKETVLAGFVSDFGLEAYSSPPAEGFNLSAWVMPFAVLLLGGLAVFIVLKKWQRAAPTRATAEETAISDDPYIQRLERELRERDT